MIKTIIGWINTVLGAILAFLPDSPFDKFTEALADADWLRFLNWLIPLQQLVVIGETWLTAITVYYLYIIVLRWIKAAASS